MSPNTSQPRSAVFWSSAVILVLATSALALPAPLAQVVLVGAVILWYRWGDRTTPMRSAGWLLLLALAVSVSDGCAALLTDRRPASYRDAEKVYRRWWSDLDESATRAAARLAAGDRGMTDPSEAFRALESIASEATTLLLIDPDGDPFAWAGGGLLHDVESQTSATRSRFAIAGFTAVTLASSRAAGGDNTAWRVVAGRSIRHEEAPWNGLWAWSVVDAPSPTASGALVRIPDTPALVLQRRAATVASPSRRWRITGLLVGLAWLSFAAARLVRNREEKLRPAVLMAAFGAILAWAAAGDLFQIVLVALGTAAAVLGVRCRVPPLQPWLAAALSGAGSLLLTALTVALLSRFPPGEDAWSGSLIGLALLGVWTGFGGWVAAGSSRPRGAALWIGTPGLIVAAALADQPGPSALLLAFAAAAFALGVAGDGGRMLRRFATAALVGSVLAAGAFEISEHLEIRRTAKAEVVDRIGPASPALTHRLKESMDEYLASLDLTSMNPGDLHLADAQDLAYAIWRRSPLNRSDVAMAVFAELDGRRSSSFAFGLPLTEEGTLDRNTERWEGRFSGATVANVVDDVAPLRTGQLTAGQVRYWMTFRPDWLGDPTPVDDLAAALLRGEPLGIGGSHRAGDASFSFTPTPQRDGDGSETRAPPTAEAPPGSGDLVFEHASERGVARVFLDRPTEGDNLFHAGFRALQNLVVAAIVLALIVAFGVSLRHLRERAVEGWKSFPRRLFALYTLLMLVPLIFLNVFVLRTLSSRLEKAQKQAGVSAIEAAQSILGDYVLTLEPGFAVATALDDELLQWLAGVVQHEINLYWGSRVYASSKPELFAAGLLPKRIPGNMYDELALEDRSVTSRPTRVGKTQYLELYAPLKVPGVTSRTSELFLSMPLLAQQEELAGELAILRRRAVLLSAALLALVALLATRLARNFTHPLMELVDGTRRIASGERSSGVRPSDTELATLATAIDRMAEEIDEGRQRLLREKRLIESMLENVTAAVVSIDGEGRAILCNRVAEERLDLQPGDAIARVFAASRFTPFTALIDGRSAATQQTTISLQGHDGREEQWSLSWVPIRGGGETVGLFVIEDVTEVVQGQRLNAWAEMARMIAHEIKNPLTPIRLSTEHMREVRHSDPQRFETVFESCTTNILEQVEELRRIAGEFSTYSQIPEIELEDGDIVAMVREVVTGYTTAPPPGVRLTIETETESLATRFDRRLLKRAVRNLVENAVRAVAGGGEVLVRIALVKTSAHITVADSGPGVAPDHLAKIFEPYFSTQDGGTGLGLPIAQRIVRAHHGAIAARNRAGGGLEVDIELPIAAVSKPHP